MIFFCFSSPTFQHSTIPSFQINGTENCHRKINDYNELYKFRDVKLPDNKNCFVAMWFNKEMKIYRSPMEKAISDAGYKPIIVDKVEHNEKICDRIIREINVSRFLVADFTGHRGGVYFEAGYAMGRGLPVIWLCEKSDLKKTHFDTRQYNHIDYSSEEKLYRRLYDRIVATIP